MVEFFKKIVVEVHSYNDVQEVHDKYERSNVIVILHNKENVEHMVPIENSNLYTNGTNDNFLYEFRDATHDYCEISIDKPIEDFYECF